MRTQVENFDRRDLIPAGLDRIQSVFDAEQLPSMLEAARRCSGIWQIAADNPCLAYMLARHECFVPDIGRKRWGRVHEWLGVCRKELLGWLGWPEEKWCVRLLSKVRMKGIKVDDLLQLRETCNESRIITLRHIPEINAEIIRIATDAELAERVCPAFYKHLALVDCYERPASEMLRHVVNMARMRAEPVPPLAYVDQLELNYHYLVISEEDRRRDAFMLRWYSKKEFPAPLFSVPRHAQPSGICVEPFHSVWDLYHWAEEQENCLFSLIDDIFAGRVFLLKILKPERGTLSLVKDSNGEWRIKDFETARNRPLSRETLCGVAGYINRCLERTDGVSQ